MKTCYEEFDGDYIDADYSKLFDDMQEQGSVNIGAYLEICASLTKDNKIQVDCSNDEGTDWAYHLVFEIPDGWDLEKVKEMFPGNVYLRTDEYLNPEEDEEE